MFTCSSRIAIVKTGFAILSSGIFGPLGFSQEVPLTNSLPESVLPQLSPILTTAMEASDSMRIQALTEEISEGAKIRLAAPSRFRALGSLSYRQERDISESDNYDSRIYYNLVLSKSIYHWGEVRALRRKGELGNEIEELNTFATFRDLALNIRAAYMELIARDYEVRVAESELALARELEERQANAVEEGLVSGDELRRARDARTRRELDALRARSNFEQQLQALAIISGVAEDSIRTSIPETIPPVERLSPEAIQRLTRSVDPVLATNSSLKRLERNVESAEQDLTIAQSTLKPKLTFESGFTQFDLDNRGVRREEELIYAGVSISWRIWDGFESRGLAKEARSRREMAIAQIDQAKRRLEADLGTAGRRLEIAALNLKIEEEFLERGREVLANTREKFENNEESRQGVEGAERGVLKQELKTIRARADYLNAVASLASLLGMDPVALKFVASKEA